VESVQYNKNKISEKSTIEFVLWKFGFYLTKTVWVSLIFVWVLQ